MTSHGTWFIAPSHQVCVSVCACVRVCVRVGMGVCVRTYVCVCVCGGGGVCINGDMCCCVDECWDDVGVVRASIINLCLIAFLGIVFRTT